MGRHGSCISRDRPMNVTLLSRNDGESSCAPTRAEGLGETVQDGTHQSDGSEQFAEKRRNETGALGFPAIGDVAAVREFTATEVPKGPEAANARGPSAMPSLCSENRVGAVLAESYRLVRKLGGGAIGDVWLADDLRLGREVAVKLVPFDRLDAVEIRRLEQEAQLTARIQHRNVVTVFDTGQQEQTFYMAMERLEGQDLAAFLRAKKSLPPTEAVRLLLPALAGIVAAHTRGIIHRDLKPENIFLVDDEDTLVPKVVDFGVALSADLPAAQRLTQAGLLVGTPLYMAPEQLTSSRALDERVDVWAACSVLYELITGAPPYAHEQTMSELVARIAGPARVAVSAVHDERLRAIIGRGLEKNPADRWPTMRHLATALARYLVDQGVSEDISGASLQTIWLRDSAPYVELDARPLSRAQFAHLARQSRRWMRSRSNQQAVIVTAAAALLVAGTTYFAGFAVANPVPSEAALRATAASQSKPDTTVNDRSRVSNGEASQKEGAKLALQNRSESSSEEKPVANKKANEKRSAAPAPETPRAGTVHEEESSATLDGAVSAASSTEASSTEAASRAVAGRSRQAATKPPIDPKWGF